MGTTQGVVVGTILGGIGGWGADICIARETESTVEGFTCTVIGGLAGATVGGYISYHPRAVENAIMGHSLSYSEQQH